jgi:hypothetical protein
MGWCAGESPQQSRELDLYDISFLRSWWGGGLSLEEALARVGICEGSFRRWTKDPAKFLPPDPVISWPAKNIPALVDTCQVAS